MALSAWVVMVTAGKAADARFFDGIAGRYDAHRPTYPDAFDRPGL